MFHLTGKLLPCYGQYGLLRIKYDRKRGHVCVPFFDSAVVNDGLRRADHYPGVGCHRGGQEGVAAYHRIFADDGLSAENGGAGVDGGAVAHGGMALAAAGGTAAGLRAPSVTP